MRNIAYQRELGCSVASSNLILLVDADTVFPLNWIEKALENFIDPEVVAVTSNISPLNVNPISLLNCWIRNLATPSVTQRACAFLFKRPVENKLFAVNGYVSKIDIDALKKRLKGKIVKDDRISVKTDIPLDQQIETAILPIAILTAIGAGIYTVKKK